MKKGNKRRNRKEKKIFCNPDVCPNCEYIGEGDSVCMATHKIVLDDWTPTDDFMGEGCVQSKGGGR